MLSTFKEGREGRLLSFCRLEPINMNSLLVMFSVTVKPVVSGHPRGMLWCPLNTGCPPNTGFDR